MTTTGELRHRSRLPIHDDAGLLGFAEAIVGNALNPGQLWWFWLDHDRRPIMEIQQFGDLPLVPDDDAATNLAAISAEVAAGMGAEATFFVLERTGTPWLTGADRRWAHSLRTAFAPGDLELVGVVLSHPDGVQVIP